MKYSDHNYWFDTEKLDSVDCRFLIDYYECLPPKLSVWVLTHIPSILNKAYDSDTVILYPIGKATSRQRKWFDKYRVVDVENYRANVSKHYAQIQANWANLQRSVPSINFLRFGISLFDKTPSYHDPVSLVNFIETMNHMGRQIELLLQDLSKDEKVINQFYDFIQFQYIPLYIWVSEQVHRILYSATGNEMHLMYEKIINLFASIYRNAVTKKTPDAMEELANMVFNSLNMLEEKFSCLTFVDSFSKKGNQLVNSDFKYFDGISSINTKPCGPHIDHKDDRDYKLPEEVKCALYCMSKSKGTSFTTDIAVTDDEFDEHCYLHIDESSHYVMEGVDPGGYLLYMRDNKIYGEQIQTAVPSENFNESAVDFHPSEILIENCYWDRDMFDISIKLFNS